MVDYRRDIPLAITFIVGVIAVLDYYLVFPEVKQTFTVIKNWNIVVSAFALGLGAVNLFRVHTRRIVERKGLDRFFSAWLLFMLIVFVVVGLSTGKFTESPQYKAIYNAIYLPLGATMYSSLCFYMAIGAYKVLRVRGLDSFLLFIAAIFVLLGNTPLFPAYLPGLFYTREWIFKTIVSGSYRGIRIGVGVGAVVLGIRTLIGLETGYLGRRE